MKPAIDKEVICTNPECKAHVSAKLTYCPHCGTLLPGKSENELIKKSTLNGWADQADKLRVIIENDHSAHKDNSSIDHVLGNYSLNWDYLRNKIVFSSSFFRPAGNKIRVPTLPLRYQITKTLSPFFRHAALASST